MESLASFGGTLLSIGIFFYTAHFFRWTPAQNFLLATAQGCIYIVGARQASRVTRRFQPRQAVAVLYLLMATAAAVAAMMSRSHAAVVASAMVYTFLAAIAWPILESLAATAGNPALLSRRVGIYNVVWPSVGMAVFALEGTILDHWPRGIFVLSGMTHAIAAWIAVFENPHKRKAAAALKAAVAVEPAHHPEPEPELLRIRTVALWVSRLALPATYAVVNGLMPLMPALPSVSRLSTTMQTIVSSIWLFTRLITFIVLASGTWWHTRPRVMIAAAVVMLLAYLGVAVSPSQLWSGSSPTADLVALLLWQSLLGVAIGVIYSGSLYFGMVLSEGSTEHGGYHEALIGLGWAIGPFAGVAAHWARPNDTLASVAAIGGVIGLSVLAVIAAGFLTRRRDAVE